MGYTVEGFISVIAPIIVKVATARGYSYPSAVIAQAILESASGNSKLASNYHNYFGMKCGSSWKGKSVNMSTQEEYTAGTLTNITANFRVYDSMEEGVEGYFDFISTSRYSNLKSATSAKNYLELLKSDGYATSSTYVTNNYNLITKYSLTQYDTGSSSTTTSTTLTPAYTLKKGSSGDEVTKLQTALNKLNNSNLTVDGKFGNLTKTALIAYQGLKNLTKDGVYGPKTYAVMKTDLGE